MRMLGVKIGNQLELAYLTGQAIPNGGPAAQDINQLFNGWQYLTQNQGGHVVDGSPANTQYSDRLLTTDKLNKLIKVIPPKYRTRQMDYRFLTSPNAYQDFIELVGNRATPFGDMAYQAAGYEQNLPAGNSVLGWGRMPMYPVPLLPESNFVAVIGGSAASSTVASGGAAAANTVTLASATGFVVGDAVRFGTGATQETHVITGIATNTLTLDANFVYARTVGDAAVRGTADGTYIMLTHFQNLIVGIQRDIRIELDRRPRERATYAVVTMRVDCQMENPDASGILTNLQIKP